MDSCDVNMTSASRSALGVRMEAASPFSYVKSTLRSGLSSLLSWTRRELEALGISVIGQRS